MGVETLPIDLVPYPASPIGGYSSVTLRITVDAAPLVATPVQIDCGDHNLLISPSGSWPYQAPIAAGASTASITIGTQIVTSSTSVQLRGGGAGANMADPSKWTATTSLTLAPALPPG